MKQRIVLFVVTGFLTFLIVFGIASQTTFGQSKAARLSGSWQAAATPTTPPGLEEPLISLITFIPNGGVVESRRLYVPASPFGPLLETTGHGEWVRTGSRKFEVAFVFLVQGAPSNSSANGTPLGTDNINLRLRLNNAGDELTGTFTSNIKDLTGKIVFTASGNYRAIPIRVENIAKTDLTT